ncbi:MAG: sulfate ABC transporter permease subunit CysT [Planctomycetaceae bacterium]|nr:sulfate ABC transporter permease subunit CysT [Planctomycetaceae bacterium]
MRFHRVRRNVLPGFGLTMGITVVYLGLVVLIPLAALLMRLQGMKFADFWNTLTDKTVIAALQLTFTASLVAAAVNVVFGFIVAWVLTRYEFPGRRFMDAMVDLPFALPTAVSGIALNELYLQTGWIGRFLPYELARTNWGIMIALIFIGLPFVVRTVQPAIMEMEKELEEVAASLGASRWQTFWKVIFPTIRPALVTGFSLAFARALGEYGSVIFIAGNQPGKTTVISRLIMMKLEQYRYQEAVTIAFLMLVTSFLMLLLINLSQVWSNRRFLK